MENIKAKIQGILLNCSQKSVIGWAVEEDDFEHVAEEIVKKLFIGSVSQQRELLFFGEWIFDQFDLNKDVPVANILENYLKLKK